MATVNEQIVTGRKFRKLIDEATKLWQRISFWTKASDVEFDDGSTAETKMGAINGITDSLVSTSSNVAASAKALSQLNNKLASGRVELVVNDDGTLGYKLDGADTVFPFNRTKIVIECLKAVQFQSPTYDKTFTYTAERDCILHIRGCGAHGGKIYGSGLSTTEGNYCLIYNGDIKLIKGQTYSLQCTISTNGGICCLGYID